MDCKMQDIFQKFKCFKEGLGFTCCQQTETTLKGSGRWVSYNPPPHCRAQWAVGLLTLQRAVGSGTPSVHCRTGSGYPQRHCQKCRGQWVVGLLHYIAVLQGAVGCGVS